MCLLGTTGEDGPDLCNAWMGGGAHDLYKKSENLNIFSNEQYCFNIIVKKVYIPI